MQNTLEQQKIMKFSRYQLAVLAAQRGRQITEGDKPTYATPFAKPTTIAIDEIERGTLSFFFGPEAQQHRENAERARRALKSQSLFKEREEELRREMTKAG